MRTGVSTQGQLQVQKSAQVAAQANLIVHRISKCVTDYPNGDNGSPTYKTYPADTAPAVSALICPGSGQNLWSGVDGVFYPAPITGFGAWVYSKAGPVTIAIASTDPAANVVAIASAATKLGPAATATASSLTVKIVQ